MCGCRHVRDRKQKVEITTFGNRLVHFCSLSLFLFFDKHSEGEQESVSAKPPN